MPAAEFSALAVILGEDCVSSCRYCYQRRDAPRVMSGETARLAVEVFAPRLAPGATVNLAGGEPLLHADLIRRLVAAFEGRRRANGSGIRFGITTNGVLLDEDTSAFLDAHRFRVVLSHDGPAHDLNRPGTRRAADAALERLLRMRRLRLEVNSVFTPRTIGFLASAAAEFLRRRVPSIRISFDLRRPWNPAALARLRHELAKLRESAAERAAASRMNPLVHEREPAAPGMASCGGGRTTMAISPDGRVWGCHLASDWFRWAPGPASRAFCFGLLSAFGAPRGARRRREVVRRYARLSMATLRVDGVPCALCPDVEECAVCPMVPAIAGYPLGTIPRHICELRKIQIEDRRLRRRALARRAGLIPAAAR